MSDYFKAPWLRLSALAAVAVMLSACNKGPQTTATPAAADGAAKPDADVVATVNGTPISRTAFDVFLTSIMQGKNVSELSTEQKGNILDQLISMQLLSAQGVKDGLENSPDVVARLALVKMRILSDAESLKYLKDHEPTDAELHAQYNTVVASGEATEYHARHILVDSKDKADKLIKKLNAGAKFEDVAKAESSDSSKTNGGDLGWFNPNGMVKPFADAVKKLKKGEMTQEPVQSQYGWHVIKLEDTREPTFDQMKPRLSENLGRKKLYDFIEDSRKTATIDKKI